MGRNSSFVDKIAVASASFSTPIIVRGVKETDHAARRIILTFKDGELLIHSLYGTSEAGDGPGPNTKRRLREVTELTRRGLQEALDALEGGTECVGTSVFTIREDVLLATTSPNADKTVKGA